MLQVAAEVLLYYAQVSSNWIVMLAVMGYNGYIFLSVVAGAGLGYAFFGESIAHARIKNVKMKAGVISCGDCQGQSHSFFLVTYNADFSMNHKLYSLVF